MSRVDGAVRPDPPILPRTYVRPARLWSALDDAAGCVVTEVVGPAGSGKSLGVAGWIEHRSTADQGPQGRPEAGTSWWTVTPELTADGLRDLLDRAALAAPGSGGPPQRLVLDNAERLSPPCVTELQAHLDRGPDRVRLVLLTRWDLPLQRLGPMLLGTMSVIRGDVMRLTDDEVRHLVALHAGECPRELVESVVDQMRGWCAAVVLAARAAQGLRHHAAADRALSTMRLVGTSASRLVGQEAFASLGPRERHVLLTVCHEELVTGSTAVHLSQDEGALEVLMGLEETGLLVQREPVSLQAGPGEDVFRVHPILLEVVRSRLAAGGADVDRARRSVVRAARTDIARGDVGAGLRRTYGGAGGADAVAALARHGLAAVVRGDGESVAVLVRRCERAVESEPRVWVAAAAERWLAGDVEAAARWSARILSADDAVGAAPVEGSARDAADADIAIAHLLRAQLGTEDAGAASQAAIAVLARTAPLDPPRDALLADLRGAASTWTGDLDTAERELAVAVMSARTQRFDALTPDALSRMALTELLRGRPAAAADLAADALRCTTTVGASAQAVADAASARLEPWRHAAGSLPPPPAAGRDLVATFVAHVTAAQRLVMRGRAAEAELALCIPPALPALPRHLAVDLRLRRALVAASCDDTDVLAEVAAELDDRDAEPERYLVEAFHAVCRSDLTRAEACLRSAAADEEKPFVAVTATVTSAQLAATRGDRRTARMLVAEAVDRGQHRRDAVPFVGWVGHLVPLHVLLADVPADRTSSPWSRVLVRESRAHGSVSALVAHRTATRRERVPAHTPACPALTAREHEVLTQLARGATYADIAATLFVSSNTVKTHVTSLYGKLGAARRSQALATARTLHLV
ncbi:LuxR family transcriptional regulator [Actinotalea sp. K2]|uniref:helix-turn-helix transcriptional regulator n=1 Tax=Actinotalea sp. K2 TaxID=2939438 RepID=UPI0020170F15|nr:LuxR family transcriptional regulator [Actinotalea sp. K2]MCL3861902.1 LuxR C-terminal-related transcriptional regulator [Actinotalea sp. K2]